MVEFPLATEKRDLYLFKQVTQESIAELIIAIHKIQQEDSNLEKIYKEKEFTYKRPPININLGTYGGSVYMVLALVDVILSSKTPIHIYAHGIAMSAGLIILICGHKRYAFTHSVMLYHEMSGIAWDKLEGVKEHVEEMKKMQNSLETVILSRTKIKLKKLQEINNRKADWYIRPKEALKLRIIDKILK